MASSLEDDLSCPVCCELYQDPQLLLCGHSFCRLCLGKHWAVSPARTCPVCRRASPQKPVANLVLRNTCETYLREKEREKECDGEVRCSQHGEKMSLFCKMDEKVICPECRRSSHSSHRVQPLIHAVHQRKTQLKAALRPAEKALEALRKGTTQNAQLSKYIESQAHRAEKLIRKEFQKFHQFLNDEEEARISALKKESDQKKKKVQEKTDREIQSLSERVKEVEDELENNGATFLQNFDFILRRAEYTEPDLQFGSESLINMPEHVGNLGYRIWERMIDILHYYPVVLDPNTAPADFSISEDLASVGKSRHDRPISVHHRGNHLVLGSKGYTDDDSHCWDIEVGDSKHWTIGVCQRSVEINRPAKPLSPDNGFWSLRRQGESYRLLVSKSNSFRLKRKLRMVRVCLGWQFTLHKPNMWKGLRMLSFLDAGDNSLIAFTSVPTGVELFPFLIPEERFSRLRIAPVNVIQTVEHTFPLESRETMGTVFAIFMMIVCLIIGMFLNKE
ncbi:nuclear factor 7, brain-like [Salminus brasiliensis]|uniref:nuclear factor 7, brain-like n=1 Tax=Salminus brasiliensis TaxID=930266 RepID=UPI003B838581